MSYLGVDLGTSGLRALLISDEGVPIGSSSQSYEVTNAYPGWSEQDPITWIIALETAVDALHNDYPAFADLRGIGVAGHMHGATLLDKNGHVLRPCILWNDTRSHAQAARLDATPGVRETSGNVVFPGFTAPKLEWVREHEPQIFEQIDKVLLPAAYLNFYLTGDHVADMSDSAGTSWLDVRGRDWSDLLLRAGHMSRAQMPRLVEGSERAGELRTDLARKWGLSGQVVVAGGAGDNAAAACGIGALSESQGFVSLGTSGVLLAARDGYHPAPETALHTFCHAVPERWYQMGVMLSATESLNWLSRISGQTPALLTKELGETLAEPGSTQFLPYLAGERTPHNDATIRGAFFGLSTATDVKALTRAVLEGVSFGLRDSAEAMKATGVNLVGLFAIGGGAASSYWLRLLATVLGVPLSRPIGSEFGAALGAARLAMCAHLNEAAEAVMLPPTVVETTEPETGLVDMFEERYAKFRDSYPLIRAAQ